MDCNKIINDAISVYEDIKRMRDIVSDFLKDGDIENAYFYIKKRENLISKAIDMDKQIVTMYNNKNREVFENYAQKARDIMYKVIEKDKEISQLLNNMQDEIGEKIKDVQKGKEMVAAYSSKRQPNKFVDRRG